MNVDLRSVRVVAEKDFRDAVRSRALLVLGALFVVFFVLSSVLFADRVTGLLQQQAAQQGAQVSVTSDTYLTGLAQVSRLLVPLTGIVVAYAAVVGERESGTMNLLLSLPHSRLSVVLGKLLGRSGVVAVPVLVGFLATAPVFPIFGVELRILGFVGFALATALVGVVFVAIALGASAAAPSSRRAVVSVVGLYALFTLLWGQFSNAVINQVSNSTDLGNVALVKVFLVVKHLNPVGTYQSLVASVGSGSAIQARASLVSGFQSQFVVQTLEQNGGLPFYLSDVALVVYLLVWVAVPVALGYLAFEGADL